MFVIHDWMTCLVPLLLHAYYRPTGMYRASRVVLAIHNIAHQVQTLSPKLLTLTLNTKH